MRKADKNWLSTIRLCSDGGGMYPGLRVEMLPNAPAKRLREFGYIELFIPHNPVHKDRWIITPEGRTAESKAK